MLYRSPIGLIKINIKRGLIAEIIFLDKKNEPIIMDTEGSTDFNNEGVLINTQKQLAEYFNGTRKNFDLPLLQEGTTFQVKVWSELVKIPYGKTLSYLQLSRRIGNVKSIRAVGTANGKNKIAIIVPCHRVIGSDGSLTGYAGGLWRKQWLLEHENKFANGVNLLF